MNAMYQLDPTNKYFLKEYVKNQFKDIKTQTNNKDLTEVDMNNLITKLKTLMSYARVTETTTTSKGTAMVFNDLIFDIVMTIKNLQTRLPIEPD